MKIRKAVLMSLLTIFFVLGASKGSVSFAQGDPPIPQPTFPGETYPGGPELTKEGIWFMPDGSQVGPVVTGEEITTSMLTATGGPDEYGYTWDDNISFSWIDASGGTDTGMSGEDEGVGPVGLPFPFDYYENTYSQVYISSSGYLTFSEPSYWDTQSKMPDPSDPNDVIAPYWTKTYIGTGGWVHYLTGGTAPNRYFVVEWHNLKGASSGTGSDDQYRFQVILHENGDIDFQYSEMNITVSYICGTGGIEDKRGLVGLTNIPFCDLPPSSNSAVRFDRPSPSARVRFSPAHQGGFFSPGSERSFNFALQNIGDLGGDTYDFVVSSNWSVSLFAADGTTPLADTDGDGMIDSGPIPQGSSLSFVAKVQAPAGADVGDSGDVEVTAKSSLDSTKDDTTIIQSTIPARFAQIYTDFFDGAMRLYLTRKNAQSVKMGSSDNEYGDDLAVARGPNGNYWYLWTKFRSEDGNNVREIKYSILDHEGNVITSPTLLTDHSGASHRVYDNDPAVAATQNGHIGVVWTQSIKDQESNERNENILFAILDGGGNLIHGPENLTNNTSWGDWNALEVPFFSDPRITSVGVDRFGVSWRQYHEESEGGVDDVYYAVMDSAGNKVKGITNFTHDTAGWDEAYYHPTMATINGNRFLLAYTSAEDSDIFYAVLNADGNVVQSPENLSGDKYTYWDYRLDAVQLSDDKILMAWTSRTGQSESEIRYALLDSAYDVVSGPTILENHVNPMKDDYVSVTSSENGTGVLTWMNGDWQMRRHLYYALIDTGGNVLTEPMIYESGMETSDPQILTSENGYGNAVYPLFSDVAFEHWSYSWIKALYNAGLTSGYPDGTYRPSNPVTRAEMAVFLLKGMNTGTYSPPAPDSSHPFSDIAGHWAEGWMEELYDVGLTSGYPDGTYRPQNQVTRAEMAVFLLRAKHGAGYSPPNASGGAFSDVEDHWAEGWIEQLADEGITGGYPDGTYRPNNPVNRAEMAVFLTKTFGLPMP